jgi:vancomycin resistance protein YoaR
MALYVMEVLFMDRFKKAVLSLGALILSACSPINEKNEEPPQEQEVPKDEATPSSTASPAPENTSLPPGTKENGESHPLSESENVISGGQTPVVDRDANRVSNLNRAASALNGKLIQPREIFSFNETVGVRSAETGYKKAAAIGENNKKIKIYGGGVCQISTTIHLAALRGDFEILERHKHTKPIPYEKTGNDATVSFGTFDYKFRNNKDYAVKIKAGVVNNTVYVNLIQV